MGDLRRHGAGAEFGDSERSKPASPTTSWRKPILLAQARLSFGSFIKVIKARATGLAWKNDIRRRARLQDARFEECHAKVCHPKMFLFWMPPAEQDTEFVMDGTNPASLENILCFLLEYVAFTPNITYVPIISGLFEDMSYEGWGAFSSLTVVRKHSLSTTLPKKTWNPIHALSRRTVIYKGTFQAPCSVVDPKPKTQSECI